MDLEGIDLKQQLTGELSHLSAELEAFRKKRGVFTLPMELVDDNPDLALKIMGKCVIYRAECMYMNNCIEYMALSECFSDIEPFEIIPRYKFMVNENGEVYAELESV